MTRLLGPFAQAPIDLRTPVNWAHPLNRDLRAWFLALPVAAGGGSRTWRDLAAKTGDGTFSDGVAGHWKPPAGRTGAFGAVDLSGSNRLDTTSNAQQDFTGLSAITMSAWIFPTATGDRVIMGRPTSDGFDDQYYMILNASTSILGGGASGLFGGNFSLSIPWATSKWNHVLITSDVSTAYCYVNGRLSASFAATGGTINSKSGAQFTIGSNRPIFFFQGQIDDVRLWARLLSATDAMQVYQLSLQGWAGLLNRPDRKLSIVSSLPPVNVSAPSVQVVVTPRAPTLSFSAFNVAAPRAQAIVTPRAPTVSFAPLSVAAPRAQAVVTPRTPTVSFAPLSVSPGRAQVFVTPRAPTVSFAPLSVAVGRGQVVVTPRTPTVTMSVVVSAPRAQVVATPRAPTISFSAFSVTAPRAQCTITGHAPSVALGGVNVSVGSVRVTVRARRPKVYTGGTKSRASPWVG